MLIANRNPNEDWSGEVLLQDQPLPAKDVELIDLEEDGSEILTLRRKKQKATRKRGRSGTTRARRKKKTLRSSLTGSRPEGQDDLLVGYMILNPDPPGPPGQRVTSEDLVTSFAHIVRDADGQDPGCAGSRSHLFQAGIARSAGFGTAVAVVVEELGATVRMTVRLNDQASHGVIIRTADFPVRGQQIFFPWEKLSDLPEQYLAAQVELLGLNGKVIAATALDVASPSQSVGVQVSGIEVRQVDGPFSLDSQEGAQ